MQCPSCGAQIPVGAERCPGCFEWQAQELPSGNQQRSKAGALFRTAILCCVMGLVALVLPWFLQALDVGWLFLPGLVLAPVTGLTGALCAMRSLSQGFGKDSRLVRRVGILVILIGWLLVLSPLVMINLAALSTWGV